MREGERTTRATSNPTPSTEGDEYAARSAFSPPLAQIRPSSPAPRPRAGSSSAAPPGGGVEHHLRGGASLLYADELVGGVAFSGRFEEVRRRRVTAYEPVSIDRRVDVGSVVDGDARRCRPPGGRSAERPRCGDRRARSSGFDRPGGERRPTGDAPRYTRCEGFLRWTWTIDQSRYAQRYTGDRDRSE